MMKADQKTRQRKPIFKGNSVNKLFAEYRQKMKNGDYISWHEFDSTTPLRFVLRVVHRSMRQKNMRFQQDMRMWRSLREYATGIWLCGV